MPSVRDLKRAIKNPKRARCLVYWFFANHSLKPCNGDSFITGREALEEVYCTFLSHQARLLLLYKKEAFDAGLSGDLDVAPHMFEGAIDDCLRNGPAWTAYNQSEKEPTNRTFFWFDKQYDIVKIPTISFTFDHLDGLTHGDFLLAKRLQVSVMPDTSNPTSKRRASLSLVNGSGDRTFLNA
ncbi:hypothetical protein C0992_012276 [Termitomyces sp. T32_za158]|nr:hypothetical protein C0992_012276 [Termitomyces sp. T32_za158]